MGDILQEQELPKVAAPGKATGEGGIDTWLVSEAVKNKYYQLMEQSFWTPKLKGTLSTTASETFVTSGPSTPNPSEKPTSPLSLKNWCALVSSRVPPPPYAAPAGGPIAMWWNEQQFHWTSENDWSLPEPAVVTSQVAPMDSPIISPPKAMNEPFSWTNGWPTVTVSKVDNYWNKGLYEDGAGSLLKQSYLTPFQVQELPDLPPVTSVEDTLGSTLPPTITLLPEPVLKQVGVLYKYSSEAATQAGCKDTMWICGGAAAHWDTATDIDCFFVQSNFQQENKFVSNLIKDGAKILNLGSFDYPESDYEVICTLGVEGIDKSVQVIVSKFQSQFELMKNFDLSCSRFFLGQKFRFHGKGATEPGDPIHIYSMGHNTAERYFKLKERYANLK